MGVALNDYGGKGYASVADGHGWLEPWDPHKHQNYEKEHECILALLEWLCLEPKWWKQNMILGKNQLPLLCLLISVMFEHYIICICKWDL